MILTYDIKRTEWRGRKKQGVYPMGLNLIDPNARHSHRAPLQAVRKPKKEQTARQIRGRIPGIQKVEADVHSPGMADGKNRKWPIRNVQ